MAITSLWIDAAIADPMMRASARLERDGAARLIGKKHNKLARVSRVLKVIRPVRMENSLREIQPNRGNL
jgi:hypothetical protein